MSTANTTRARFGPLRGLLFMRIRELSTPTALVRSGVIFAATFGLMLLLKLDSDGASGAFQALVGSTFALWFLPIFCLTKGGETLRSELKEGTIEYLWVRPASKVQLYFGFYLSGLLGTFSIIVPCLFGISLAGVFLGVLGGQGMLTLWLTVFAVVTGFSAISSAISSFSSKFVVLGIFYFSFVELGLGKISNGIQKLAVSFHARELLAGLGGAGSVDTLARFGWIFGIVAVALLVGAVIFSQARYIAGSEKEG